MPRVEPLACRWRTRRSWVSGRAIVDFGGPDQRTGGRLLAVAGHNITEIGLQVYMLVTRQVRTGAPVR